MPWEVVLVENGSTDNTVKVARASWPNSPPAPLRILSETTLGLSRARLRGLESAIYDITSFVDDDNRVARNWISRVSSRMTSDPTIGACGAWITAAFEAAPPEWWDEFAGCFAVGRQWPDQGDVTSTKGWLYGAGLTVRKSAWNKLRSDGFRFYTEDRRGTVLSGGGDNELCYALRLAGWKLWLDWSIELRHFIPQDRVTWDYVRRLHRAAGATELSLRGYGATKPTDWRGRLRMYWWWQALATIKELLIHPSDYWAYLFSHCEGHRAVLRTESRLGRLTELLRLRSRYREALIQIRDARWRRQAAVTEKPMRIQLGRRFPCPPSTCPRSGTVSRNVLPSLIASADTDSAFSPDESGIPW